VQLAALRIEPDGAERSLRVLEGQLARYADLPRHIEELGKRSVSERERNVTLDGKIVREGGEAVFGFGKHRGASLRRSRGYHRGAA
jgi:hypothetical protein